MDQCDGRFSRDLGGALFPQQVGTGWPHVRASSITDLHNQSLYSVHVAHKVLKAIPVVSLQQITAQAQVSERLHACVVRSRWDIKWQLTKLPTAELSAVPDL